MSQWAGDGTHYAYNVYGAGPDEILWRYDSRPGYGHLRYHHDRHGNVTSLLNEHGSIIEKYSYDAFGTPKVTDPYGNDRKIAGRYASWYANRFLFQGREWIAELGIYDYRHRMYHPQLGRFLQSDPIGLQTEGAKLSAAQKALFAPGGVAPEAFTTSEMNLYRYCGDDPVDNSDPTGLDDSAWRWVNVPKIEIQKTGNWGERTGNYYRSSVTCDGAAAEGCTNAKMTDLKPLADGGLKATIHVDVAVLETHKGDLVDDREQDHPNGFKKLLKDISTKVHIEMVQDKRSYNSLEEYAAGRARHLYRLFKQEKDAQERWHQKGGRHDYNNPEFRQKQK